MVDELQVAWAAGIFEGEGCIGIWFPPSKTGRWKHPQVRLQLIMTDRDIVERFCEVVECGKVSLEQRRDPPRKNCWVWTIGNRHDAERIIRLFYPLLGERRRAKADQALAEIAKRKAELTRTCDHCGSKFEAKRELARFCSTPCQQRDYYAKHGNTRVAERAAA